MNEILYLAYIIWTFNLGFFFVILILNWLNLVDNDSKHPDYLF